MSSRFRGSARPRLEWISLAAAGLAVLVAALVLIGWMADSAPMTRVLLGTVSMNPMTAVAFALTGLSLWLQADPPPALAATSRRAAEIAAATVVVIGMLKLVALTTGWDAASDQWLFADRLDSLDASAHNRMAPNTALCFVLLGVALLALDATTRRGGGRPAQALAGAVALVALLALTGYLYGVPEFTGLAHFIPMALATALVFLALALGIFAARPGAGVMAVVTSPGLGGTMARRLFPAMLLGLLGLGWLRLEGEQRGLYGMELGVALYTVANITILGALVLWHAKSLHRVDAERERLTAQQRDSEAQVRLLLDSTAEAIYGIDAEGLCTFINLACVRMLGYTDSQALLGKNMHALIHYARPDGTPYPVTDCHIYRAIQAKVPGHVDDEVFWRADGTSFAVEYWSHPMLRHGTLVGAVVTFLDITARKQAEELLRQSHAKTQAIIETASDAFIAIDRFGMILDWNASAETVFGWPRGHAIGQQLSKTIIPHQYRKAHDRGLDHYLLTGEGPVLNRTIEITALHRDGHQFPVELTIWPVTVGVSTTFNAFVRDITERKEADDRILALNNELSANAAQLEQTNRELEAFSYSISHDLRAPLRHIDGYARMLEEDAGDQLNPELRRYLDTISQSARQMGTLIDDLLAFSRLGRKSVERTEVDMGALVARVVQEAGAGGDRVSVGLLPPSQADPVLLKQVWVNLVSNALKYSAPRGDAARIEVSGELADGVARYRICDNGVGFDMRYADKLFGVFQRLHSAEEFEGTGVGLAIVQRIVVRHGGTIGAESEPGSGATFTFELPVGGDSTVAAPEVPATPATETPA